MALCHQLLHQAFADEARATDDQHVGCACWLHVGGVGEHGDLFGRRWVHTGLACDVLAQADHVHAERPSTRLSSGWSVR